MISLHQYMLSCLAISLLVSCADTAFSSSSPIKKSYSTSGNQGLLQANHNPHTQNSADTRKSKSGQNFDNDSADSDQDLAESDTNDIDDSSDNESDYESLAAGQHKQSFIHDSDHHAPQVEIIFAMDTSGSMKEEKSHLESAMADFLKNFEKQSLALDYQMYMIGNGFSFPGTGEKIIKVPLTVGSHNALSVLTHFFTQDVGITKALRPESSKHIIVISDDNAQGTTSGQFKDFIQKTQILSNKTSFHGIVGQKNGSNNPECSIEQVGQTYLELSKDREISGLSLDLCRSDWTALLQELASKIIQKSALAEYKLDKPANTKKPIKVFVDNKPIDSSVYQYIEKTQTIKISEQAQIQSGSEIQIVFWPNR